MDPLSERWLGHAPIAYKDVAGSGKSAVTFDMVDIDRATAHAAEDADVTLRLWQVLKPRLAAEGLMSVYERLERPLVDVLARMEERGIAVDRQVLSRLSGDLAQAAAAYERRDLRACGREIHHWIAQTAWRYPLRQDGAAGASKTKHRPVVDLRAGSGRPCRRRSSSAAQDRGLAPAYQAQIHLYGCAAGFHQPPDQARPYTPMQWHPTSTGRLSSSDPNLQNIPVRTAEGRKIRTAFIAEPGNKLISADYSQIELRVLAHVADIAQLKQAFADGIDIHAMTASEMFGVPVEGMPSEVRRRAKAINFRHYLRHFRFRSGRPAFHPARGSGQYIRTYFEAFSRHQGLVLEATKAFAREHGYVETIFGRRTHYPDIRASNPQVRAFNERAAINAPIQGLLPISSAAP